MSSLPLTRLGPVAGFSRDARFAALWQPEQAPKGEAPPPVDPVTQAYERGYREGAAAAAAAAEKAERERDEARAAIHLSFARLDDQSAVELRERLRQSVLALCESAIMPLAVDPDGLTARVERAVSMLQRAQDERLVRLNPEDLALVRDRLPQGLKVLSDPSVERGGLRIETSDGGVEDGPANWRRILEEAFREC
jgi:flagellar assembly protein FliH